jgi:hypothetical protein
MGEGGCPSRVRGLREGHRLSPNGLLTVQDYRRSQSKSQENTLRNQNIILLFKAINWLMLSEKTITLLGAVLSRLPMVLISLIVTQCVLHALS